ncbi:Eukaryotic peptide chain release factor GTP-binding subunit ERF3A [Gracilariopsis chorda]|uniref:Eukaryotic peptide chain release factor GTP-binding subunit ERF3A n=1 Tax=Gracilariopsis chorda TaxID=448386 RepID=A0A2V3IFR8_9FLOR|nr:Eukaryotic peptide chain release factor GTP-binding subunit ERF3A [Gracilariopsis chorda]|eukprot:PXF40901.1 Eukaryotic peptide chain release factor GTP-binding subunit ERF3A [Gracilariopsis chorda]
MNPQASEFIPSWLASSAQQQQQQPEAQTSWEDEDAAPGQVVQPPVQELSAVRISDNTPDTKPKANNIDSQPPVQKAPKGDAKRKESTANEKANQAANSAPDFDPSDFDLDEKKPLNVVLLGHVDAGKSTISGHLLVLTGNVDERTMDKYEKEAKALNRESWKFAFALDTSEQERQKGKTEECGQASFTTETRRFTILDAPGHKNYVPHMIGGASQADIGILVISARKGEFETGFERGGQTREHAMLAKTSGVRQMVVVVNKLDDPSVTNPDGSWNEERFFECKKKLEPYLRNVGWNPKGVVWIPVSGLTGDNLKHKPPKEVCDWYDGQSLLDTLEHLRPPERLLNGPVKMPISEKHKEMGTMVMGKLESGVIQVNDALVMMPNRVEVVVDAVQLEGSTAQAAEPGDVVRLRLKGIDEEEVRVGFVLCSPRDLVSYTRSFIAKLMILEHKSIICAGYSAVIHIHAAVEEVSIVKLLAELNKSGKAKQRHPKFVKPGMKCLALLRTTLPVCVEPYDVFPQLGRFMIRDEGKTVAVGTVARLQSD